MCVLALALALLAGCGGSDDGYEIVRERPTVVVEVEAGLSDQEALRVIEEVRVDPRYDDRRVSLRCPDGLERAASVGRDGRSFSIADC